MNHPSSSSLTDRSIIIETVSTHPPTCNAAIVAAVMCELRSQLPSPPSPSFSPPIPAAAAAVVVVGTGISRMPLSPPPLAPASAPAAPCTNNAGVDRAWWSTGGGMAAALPPSLPPPVRPAEMLLLLARRSPRGLFVGKRRKGGRPFDLVGGFTLPPPASPTSSPPLFKVLLLLLVPSTLPLALWLRWMKGPPAPLPLPRPTPAPAARLRLKKPLPRIPLPRRVVLLLLPLAPSDGGRGGGSGSASIESDVPVEFVGGQGFDRSTRDSQVIVMQFIILHPDRRRAPPKERRRSRRLPRFEDARSKEEEDRAEIQKLRVHRSKGRRSPRRM